MSHYDTIIEDVKRLNDSKSMNFQEWMIWGHNKDNTFDRSYT